jgi:hypothetical protein
MCKFGRFLLYSISGPSNPVASRYTDWANSVHKLEGVNMPKTPALINSFLNKVTYAATPPNQPQRCILTDYFNNYNFSKLK